MTEVKDKMDRAIPKSQIRKKQLRIWGISIFVLIVIVLLFSYGLKLIKPVFIKGEFKTALVELGSVSESIMASGKVETESEILILSPINGKLEQIKRAPGSLVNKNDTILQLETDQLQRDISLQEDQLALKENASYQSELSQRNEALEQAHQLEVKKLNIISLETRLGEEKQLFEVGGISQERVRKTVQELDLAKKELALAEKQYIIRKEKRHTEQKAMALEIKMKKGELQQQYAKLKATTLIANSSGVIISIAGKEGGIVREDQELVRISNLNAFKITGQISDTQAEKIKSGGGVLAIINKIKLEGLIGNIRPEVEHGQVKFDVFLKDNNHASLRPNLQVELQLIIAERNEVLSLPDGPYYDGAKKMDVFRIKDNKAELVEIEIGLCNFENIEIISGLSEGDEVIISDVAKYKHLQEVEIKNN